MPMTNKQKAQQHARRPHHCTCGKVAYGNGGWASHRAMHERRGDGHKAMHPVKWREAFEKPPAPKPEPHRDDRTGRFTGPYGNCECGLALVDCDQCEEYVFCPDCEGWCMCEDAARKATP